MGLMRSPSVYFPPLSSRSEQVCLASSHLLHTHLALAGTPFNNYFHYYGYHQCRPLKSMTAVCPRRRKHVYGRMLLPGHLTFTLCCLCYHTQLLRFNSTLCTQMICSILVATYKTSNVIYAMLQYRMQSCSE